MSNQQSRSELVISAVTLLHQAGLYQKAIEILQDLIDEEPELAPAHTLLGALYQAIGESARAEYHYRKALLIDSENLEALQGLGLFLVSTKRYAEALPYLEGHFRKNPSDRLTLDGLIKCLDHLPGHQDDVLLAIKEAWEQTNNKEVGIRYARALIDTGKLDEAQKVLSEIVYRERTPQNLTELAKIYILKENLDIAADLLREALSIDPTFERGWLELSQCLLQAEDKEKALEAIERAIALNPTNYLNWLVKTQILFSLRWFEKALESAQMGIDIIHKLAQPEREKAAFPVSVLYLQRFLAFLGLGQKENALEDMEVARSEYPDIIPFYVLPVKILCADNKADDALKILDSAPNPNNDALVLTRFEVLTQLERYDEAWEVIGPLLTRHEKLANHLANIGVTFYTRGLADQAIFIYRKLLSITPDDVRVLNNLGYFLIEKERFTEAEDLLKRVLANPEDKLFSEIAHCNLAYLYNLTGRYQETLEICMKVIQSEYRFVQAVLRVSFWIANKMHPDPVSIPGRNLTLVEASLACAVAAALATQQFSLAENLILELQAKSQNERLIKLVSKCLEVQRGIISPEEALDFIQSESQSDKPEVGIPIAVAVDGRLIFEEE